MGTTAQTPPSSSMCSIMMSLLSLARDVVVVDAWRCGHCGHDGGRERVCCFCWCWHMSSLRWWLSSTHDIACEVVVVVGCWECGASTLWTNFVTTHHPPKRGQEHHRWLFSHPSLSPWLPYPRSHTGLDSCVHHYHHDTTCCHNHNHLFCLHHHHSMRWRQQQLVLESPVKSG
jgi:hypothetical protein